MAYESRKLLWENIFQTEKELLSTKIEKHLSVEGRIRIKHKILLDVDILSCQGLKSENLVAVGLSDGRIMIQIISRIPKKELRYTLSQLYNVPDANFITALTDADLTVHSAVHHIRFLSEDLYSPVHHIMVAAYSTGQIKFWDYCSHACLDTLIEKQNILTMAINPGNTQIATAGIIPKLNIYDLKTKKIINTLQASILPDEANGHSMRVFAAKYHPSIENVLISGGWDNTVQFWDSRQENSIRRIYGPFICGEGLDIFDEHILTASWRQKQSLELWHFDSGKKIKEIIFDLHQSHLYCCQWLSKHYVVTGGSEENIAMLIDCHSWLNVGSLFDLAGPVYCQHSFDCPLIMFVGSGHTFFILDTATKDRKV